MENQAMQEPRRKDILNNSNTVKQKCTHQQFDIYDYHSDKKFRKVEQDLAPAEVQIRVAGQQVQKSQISIQIVKVLRKTHVSFNTIKMDSQYRDITRCDSSIKMA